ncbi:pyridoxal phosphate-dependent aminotransferase [Nesterenkonia haasae]|uniref:pyridoxal phosphate-dependent aminotransferase n=1 Tax=Nesterenkonia haasae TaxID=2587813 RepID=UPI001390C7DD|nr:aminotransferase class I/II-fold pyridoxal phosphate-dependent enzyme [Nesterenkonia haasae]NDK32208.1 aminotransferase class I/II-fold pyridoxal phosphate-dependent enzyme [Nesterenkonia haasae]
MSTTANVPRISEAASSMPRSGIREIMDLAWSTGDDVIGLHVGEPSFPMSTAAHTGAIEALQAGHTRYAPNAGIPELRSAIARRLAEDHAIDAQPEDVIVTSGGMQAISLAMAAVVRPGDEILIPDPGWPNFAMAAHLMHTSTRHYQLTAENGFLPDLAELERIVSPRTRMLILNSPSNPLGTVFDRDTLVGLLDFAQAHGLWVLSDECYDAITFDQPHISPASLGHAAKILSCFSFSKTYSMTGMRVGYLLTPPGEGPAMAKLQEPLLSCVNAPAQYAALAALNSGPDFIEQARQTYRQRRNQAAELLDSCNIPYLLPQGAFYMWIDVREMTDSAVHFARQAVVDKNVAVAPGTAFGVTGEGYIRVSLAAPTDQVLEGLTRLFNNPQEQP